MDAKEYYKQQFKADDIGLKLRYNGMDIIEFAEDYHQHRSSEEVEVKQVSEDELRNQFSKELGIGSHGWSLITEAAYIKWLEKYATQPSQGKVKVVQEQARAEIRKDISQPPPITEEEIIELIKTFVDHTAYGPGKLIGLEEAARVIIEKLKR